MLDLFGNHIVGFPTRRLNYEGSFVHIVSGTSISYYPLSDMGVYVNDCVSS